MQDKGVWPMLIEVKHAKKEYGSGETLVRALDDVNLSFAEGKIYVILGPSGSGKSTLLNMIGGLDSLDGGEIIVGGMSLKGMGKGKLANYRRRNVGFVFQFSNLIPDLTVRENIEVVEEIADDPLDVDTVLDALDIEKYKSRFLKELSDGQQQRVAIARALVKNPKLLLCDEPTGALDSKSSRNVLKSLEQVNARFHTTILISTQNEAIADMADCVIRLEDGHVASCEENAVKKSAVDLEL